MCAPSPPLGRHARKQLVEFESRGMGSFPDLLELYLAQESLRIVWREYTANQMNINSVVLGAKKIFLQYLICSYEGNRSSVLQGLEHGGVMSL